MFGALESKANYGLENRLLRSLRTKAPSTPRNSAPPRSLKENAGGALATPTVYCML